MITFQLLKYQLNWRSTGIHFVLFCICIFILVRNRRPTQWFILVSAIVMFALSTADIAITFRFMTHDVIDVFGQDVFGQDVFGQDVVTSIPALKEFLAKNLIFVSNKSVLNMMSIALVL